MFQPSCTDSVCVQTPEEIKDMLENNMHPDFEVSSFSCPVFSKLTS